MYGCENCYNFQNCSRNLILNEKEQRTLDSKIEKTKKIYIRIKGDLKIEQSKKDKYFKDIYSMNESEFKEYCKYLNNEKMKKGFVKVIKKLRRLKLYAYRDVFLNKSNKFSY